MCGSSSQSTLTSRSSWQLTLLVTKTLRRYGWTYDVDGTGRTLRLTCDGTSTIRQWVATAVRQEQYLAKGRVWKPRTRPRTEETATGLDRPAPALGRACFPVTDAHRQFGKGRLRPASEAAVALGAALSCWHFAKKHEARPSEVTKCACGKTAPSMPHIFWNCDSYAHRRKLLRFVRLPVDKSRGKLLVPTIAAPPAPLPVPDGESKPRAGGPRGRELMV